MSTEYRPQEALEALCVCGGVSHAYLIAVVNQGLETVLKALAGVVALHVTARHKPCSTHEVHRLLSTQAMQHHNTTAGTDVAHPVCVYVSVHVT